MSFRLFHRKVAIDSPMGCKPMPFVRVWYAPIPFQDNLRCHKQLGHLVIASKRSKAASFSSQRPLVGMCCVDDGDDDDG